MLIHDWLTYMRRSFIYLELASSVLERPQTSPVRKRVFLRLENLASSRPACCRSAMKKAEQRTNPVVLRRGVGIGSGNAESDDEFLFDCFVDHPGVERARLLTSPGMIITGRTGAGKTAILRHIEESSRQSVALDPFDMAMSYVANSDALRFLEAIGADLDLLFQVLWKHVLCIEFIRLKFSIEGSEKSKSVFARIADQFRRDERKARALAYLREWEGRFWITMDQNVKELTESVERKLHAEIGGDIQKFKAGGQYDKRLSTEKKSEIVARTRKIISQEQLAELHGVIDMLSTFESGDAMKGYYILIDRLDERWVDDTVRFRMIKALIESLRSFRKVTKLKILVALRADVLERVVQETADISFQREKFEDYRIDLQWSKPDLKSLVEKRLNALFKRQYTTGLIGFGDIFPNNVGPKETFDWIAERTLLRPRDVIAFVNECIDASDGKPQVTLSALRKAETEFARKRRDALLQEWRSSYPTLDKLLTNILKDGRSACTLNELAEDGSLVDDMCLSICSDGRIAFDPLHKICQAHIDGKDQDNFKVVQEAAAILYRTGAFGVKLGSQERFLYSHLDQPLVSPDILTRDTRLRLHPMLSAAYNVQDRQAR